MGMIFNSVDTLTILEALNDRYSSNKINGHRNSDLRILRGAGNSHAKSAGLGVDTPIKPHEPKSRWHVWLDKMDAIMDPHSGMSVGNTIQAYMIAFLEDAHCQAIEFYAVEANVPMVIPTPAAPPNDGTDYFAVLTVQTPVWNAITLDLRAKLNRKPKGVRKKAEGPGVRAPAEGRNRPKK